MVKKISLVLLLLLLPSVVMATTYRINFNRAVVGGGILPSPDQGYATYALVTTPSTYMTFKTKPNAGNVVKSVSIAPAINADVSALAADGSFRVTPKAGAPTLSLTVVFGPQTVPTTVTAVAGPSQNLSGVGIAHQVNLAGSATSFPVISGLVFTYHWSVNDSNAHLTAPDSQITGFYADSAGVYSVSLVATAGGVSSPVNMTSVTVTIPYSPDSAYCKTCHTARSPLVVAAYDLSNHNLKPQGPSCQRCHLGTKDQYPDYPGGHIYPNGSILPPRSSVVGRQPVTACSTCHVPGNSVSLSWPPAGFPFHTAYTGGSRCVECHDPHSTLFNGNLPTPHFANSTTSAQYVNPNTQCVNCHQSLDVSGNVTFDVLSANTDWAASGKGNPTSPTWVTYQFKSMGSAAPATPATSTGNDCVRCHTTTGYIQYVSSNFSNIAPFAPASGSREMIACSACHYTPFNSFEDPNSGTTYNRRVVGVDTYGDGSQYNVYGYYGYSSLKSKKNIRRKVYPDSGDSNICITCHTGKSAGSNITDLEGIVGATGSFWQNVPFINPHYMGAAGLLYQEAVSGTSFKIGYEYRSWSSYRSINFAHPSLGDSFTGPCVECHMAGSARKHLFSPVSSSQGSIKAITSSTCFATYCHDSGSFNGSFLQNQKDGYKAAMSVIATQLSAMGIYYNKDIYPYFFTTSDPTQQNFATGTVNWQRVIGGVTHGSKIMGGAFNLKLLQADGGSWAHNDVYIKRLLYDTIDFLDDGNPNNNTVYATIQNLSGVDSATKLKAQAYITPRR